jgi:hypothetical protein
LSGFFIFVLDQVTKYYVVHMLELDRVRAIDVFPPYLNLRMAWNYGINFGLFARGYRDHALGSDRHRAGDLRGRSVVGEARTGWRLAKSCRRSDGGWGAWECR